MPMFYLTARFAWTLVQAEEAKRFADAYEEHAHVFYQTDSPTVARMLQQMFECSLPTIAKGDSEATFNEMYSILSRGRVVPVALVELIDGSSLPVPQRLAYVSAFARLGRHTAVQVRSSDNLSRNETRTLLLLAYHERARQWEPIVRQELQVDALPMAVTSSEPVENHNLVAGQTTTTASQNAVGEPNPGPRASIPNEPISLHDFMAKFCEYRSKENRVYRKRALLAAARHGTVKLPPLAAGHKHGMPNRYFVKDLLTAWQSFLDEGVDLPPLLQQCAPRGGMRTT